MAILLDYWYNMYYWRCTVINITQLRAYLFVLSILNVWLSDICKQKPDKCSDIVISYIQFIHHQHSIGILFIALTFRLVKHCCLSEQLTENGKTSLDDQKRLRDRTALIYLAKYRKEDVGESINTLNWKNGRIHENLVILRWRS